MPKYVTLKCDEKIEVAIQIAMIVINIFMFIDVFINLSQVFNPQKDGHAFEDGYPIRSQFIFTLAHFVAFLGHALAFSKGKRSALVPFFLSTVYSGLAGPLYDQRQPLCLRQYFSVAKTSVGGLASAARMIYIKKFMSAKSCFYKGASVVFRNI